MMLQRIYRILQSDERRKMWNVVLTVLFSAMLDFIGLAMLLPVLYYLLEGGENQQAAFWFSLLAVGVVLFTINVKTNVVIVNNTSKIINHSSFTFIKVS